MRLRISLQPAHMAAEISPYAMAIVIGPFFNASRRLQLRQVNAGGGLFRPKNLSNAAGIL
jgi:hypothetical protein